MSVSFAQVLAQAEPTADGFTALIPDTWLQGRTAYGGFSAALALEAARQVGGDGLPPLRSAAVSFVGPTSSMVNVSARLLRKGRNATWMAAEIGTGGGTGLTATFAFMGSIESALNLSERPVPADLIALDDAAAFAFQPHTPLFLRHNFEVRFARPRGTARQAELSWWVRLAQREGLDPMTEIMLIADSLPPGVLPLLHAGVPVSSMNWQANLLTSAPATRDGWWLLRSTGDYAQAGCSSQQMAIWNADGEPVMAGMQSVALFG